ncbi:MSC_0882 family membrane protein [Candidatus Mycoplasma pogonae]
MKNWFSKSKSKDSEANQANQEQTPEQQEQRNLEDNPIAFKANLQQPYVMHDNSQAFYQKQNKAIIRIFKNEKYYKNIALIVYGGIFLLAVLLILLIYFLPDSFAKDVTIAPWHWFLLPGIIGALSLFLCLSNVIDFIDLNKKQEAISLFNPAAPYPEQIRDWSALIYKKIVFRQIHFLWTVIFIIFYFGLFTFIVWLLNYFTPWIVPKDAVNPELSFHDYLWKEYAFSFNTLWKSYLITSGILLLLVAAMFLYRKHKLNILKQFVLNKDLLHVNFYESKRKRNKLCFFLCLAPLVILLLLLWITKTIIKITTSVKGKK